MAVAPSTAVIHRPVTLRRILALAVIAASASCKSTPQRLAEQVEGGASWTATADMAATAWTRNRVPVRYAERTLEEAHAKLHASVRQASKLRSAPGDDDALQLLAGAEQAVVQLADAVRRRNIDAARARLPAVTHAARQLRTLHDRLEPPQ